MKKILLFGIVAALSFTAAAQTVKPLKYDPIPVLGTWLANRGDTSYYTTFTIGVIEYGYNTGYSHKEIFEARILYCVNNRKYKDTDYKSRCASLGEFDTPNEVYISISDGDTKFRILVTFTITGTTATWVAVKERDLAPAMGWPNIPDIPMNLTFTKISDSTTPPDIPWKIGYGPTEDNGLIPNTEGLNP